MPRHTGESAQRLMIRGREHVIPANTSVTLNFAGLHSHTDYWGSDALAFRPDRWIVHGQKNTGEPGLFQPVNGAFIPWNWGPRICTSLLPMQALRVSSQTAHCPDLHSYAS